MLFEEKDPDLLLAFGMLHSLTGNCLLVKFSSADQRTALHISLWEFQLLHSERRKKNNLIVLCSHGMRWTDMNQMWWWGFFKNQGECSAWNERLEKLTLGGHSKEELDADHGPELTELQLAWHNCMPSWDVTGTCAWGLRTAIMEMRAVQILTCKKEASPHISN